MFTDKFSRFCSLCRVCKAHTEFIASGGDTINCCTRWCKEECALCCFGTNCNTCTRCYCTTKHLHSFVEKVIVCIDCFFRVSLVISCSKNFNIISVESAVCIYFFSCKLYCMIYTKSILCIISCHRSNNTNLKCLRFICKYCCWHHCCCHSYCCCYCKYSLHIFHNKILLSYISSASLSLAKALMYLIIAFSFYDCKQKF